jgi:hypothetical protein
MYLGKRNHDYCDWEPRPGPPPVSDADKLPEAAWLPCCGPQPGSFASICQRRPQIAVLLSAAYRAKKLVIV